MTLPERPDWDDRDETQYGLLFPFTCVQSAEGPYDDQGFLAGFQMGEVYGRLQNESVLATTFLVYSKLTAQADLIAMNAGFKMDILHDDGEWAQIGLLRTMKMDDEPQPT